MCTAWIDGFNGVAHHLDQYVDLNSDREGNQDSTVSVFKRDGDGTVRHFYSAHTRMATEYPGSVALIS